MTMSRNTLVAVAVAASLSMSACGTAEPPDAPRPDEAMRAGRDWQTPAAGRRRLLCGHGPRHVARSPTRGRGAAVPSSRSGDGPLREGAQQLARVDRRQRQAVGLPRQQQLRRARFSQDGLVAQESRLRARPGAGRTLAVPGAGERAVLRSSDGP